MATKRARYAWQHMEALFVSWWVFVVIEITTGSAGGIVGGLLGAVVGVVLPALAWLYFYLAAPTALAKEDRAKHREEKRSLRTEVKVETLNEAFGVVKQVLGEAQDERSQQLDELEQRIESMGRDTGEQDLRELALRFGGWQMDGWGALGRYGDRLQGGLRRWEWIKALKDEIWRARIQRTAEQWQSSGAYEDQGQGDQWYGELGPFADEIFDVLIAHRWTEPVDPRSHPDHQPTYRLTPEGLMGLRSAKRALSEPPPAPKP